MLSDFVYFDKVVNLLSFYLSMNASFISSFLD